jgi:hypothetical protein
LPGREHVAAETQPGDLLVELAGQLDRQLSDHARVGLIAHLLRVSPVLGPRALFAAGVVGNDDGLDVEVPALPALCHPKCLRARGAQLLGDGVGVLLPGPEVGEATGWPAVAFGQPTAVPAQVTGSSRDIAPAGSWYLLAT